jgi:hypothetical protein
MKRMHSFLFALAMLLFAGAAWAGGGDLGQAEKQPINWTAISMFAVFVCATLWITKWAAAKTVRRRTSTPPAAASPASRTAWRSPATTCRRPRSWAFPQR